MKPPITQPIEYYLASSLDTKQQAAEFTDLIYQQSHTQLRCNSRWLTDELQGATDTAIAAVNRDDLDNAQFILVLEGQSTSGGLHWEAGYAAAQNKFSIVVKGAHELLDLNSVRKPIIENIYYTTGHKWTESINMCSVDLTTTAFQIDSAMKLAYKIVAEVAEELRSSILDLPRMQMMQKEYA